MTAQDKWRLLRVRDWWLVLNDDGHEVVRSSACFPQSEENARAVVAAHNASLEGGGATSTGHCENPLTQSETFSGGGGGPNFTPAHNAQCEAEPVAPDQPNAPPTQRVSDVQIGWALLGRSDGYAPAYRLLALDLRDTRAALADAQTALAARDARIAELEKERDAARQSRAKLHREIQQRTSKLKKEERAFWMASIGSHRHLSAYVRRQTAIAALFEETARADRLEAQLQAARAAGPDDLPTEIATSFCCEPLVRQLCEMKARMDYPNADKWGFAENATSNMGDLHGLLQEHALKALRARLTAPAEPTADTGEKG